MSVYRPIRNLQPGHITDRGEVMAIVPEGNGGVIVHFKRDSLYCPDVTAPAAVIKVER